MKKILTIFTTAGLLAALSSSAQAADVLTGTVSMPGSVDASCTINSVTPGVLTQDAVPATKLTTTTAGQVKVTCNSASSKLDIAVNTGTSTLFNGSATTAFGPAGTGIYNGASGTTVTASTVTAALGDTARVRATVNAPAGQLLQTGSYNVNVDAILTP
jgi:hypothetical protein